MRLVEESGRSRDLGGALSGEEQPGDQLRQEQVGCLPVDGVGRLQLGRRDG